ncbi:alpha/beta fold hydrolase [Mycoplasma sp. CSL10166]|uniref:alpha/beta fold hydrolase n=1 Tax=Mycoplasma sp. CSL10166 TaxID=2813825 RepID=UPI00197C57E6|nr:alpha/beta fold hydrolase [Mycoplasma sp. CSL10166]MBN4084653.1 alpha/beta hydrolase [Mycoplasma sp. CSL10166]
MRSKSFYGENNIYVSEWKVENPKGIIQFVHGLGDQIDRYEDFAEFFNSKGYIVVGNDNYGHGNTIDVDAQLGIIPEDINELINSVKTLNILIKKKYPELPIYLFGHSMGSLISLLFATKNSENINGLFLIGFPYYSNIQGLVGIRIIKYLEKKYGKDFKYTGFKKFIEKRLNRKIKNPSNEFEWLSSDKTYYESYILNSKFKKMNFPSLHLTYALIQFSKNAYDLKILKNINKSIPVSILAGKNDSIGLFGKAPKKLYLNLVKLGLQNLNYKIYKNSRHNIIHDVEKEIVFNDIYKIIKEINRHD